MPFLSPYMRPIVLLLGSNVFMTAAWYWHLRYKEVPIIYVIFISWGLAFVEYCLAVPANRYGSAVYNPAQLKTMQEVITFVVFAGFSYLYLQQPITLSQGFGFALIVACRRRSSFTTLSPVSSSRDSSSNFSAPFSKLPVQPGIRSPV